MNTASLIELQYALTTMNNHNGFSPSIILLTETWECRLSRAEPTLKGYTYIGEPIDKPEINCHKPHEGMVARECG